MNYMIKTTIFVAAALAMTFPVFAYDSRDAKNEETGYGKNDSAMGTDYRDEDANQVKANNTALNSRDRNQNALTPLNQGNNQADTAVTAAIRKDIMAREGMSIDAQNVKIITQNGKVTLRGPVRTLEEKNFISETARGRFSPGNVDDQLEVVGNIQTV